MSGPPAVPRVAQSLDAKQGTAPTQNTVRDNELHDNMPVDLYSDGTGSANRFLENECATTSPANLGGCG